MKKYLSNLITLLILTSLCPASIYAQDAVTPALDSASFDFWLGDWNLTWDNGDSTIGKGTNKIHRIMNGAVIQENFEATDAGQVTGYQGMSVSVFNKRSGEWKQTWVDNQGGYLDFTGAIDGEKKMFQRSATGPDGKSRIQRMVFYNIKDDKFDWDWEISADDGKTWKLAWRIHYARK